MKPVLILGPSRSGKTTLCQKLAERDSHFTHLWLDEEVKQLAEVQDHNQILQLWGGKQKLWAYFKTILENFNPPSEKIVLIDVGAGALYTDQGRKHFLETGLDSIFIYCSPDQLYRRQFEKLALEGQKLTRGKLLKMVYFEQYQTFYSAAKFVIDTSSSDIDEAVKALQTAALILGK